MTFLSCLPQRVPSGIPLPPELQPPTRPKAQPSRVTPPQGKINLTPPIHPTLLPIKSPCLKRGKPPYPLSSDLLQQALFY